MFHLSKKSVSLIADGATWENRALYFVVAFTPRNIHLLDILHLESTEHFSIAEEMGKLVMELKAGQTIVRSVTTDNASNFRRALDPKQLIETLQSITDERILHVRCGIHTANLAFVDLENASPEFAEFKSHMTSLLNWLRKPEQRHKLRERGVTSKVPRIAAIKWCTYSDGARFLYDNREIIDGLLMEKRSPEGATPYPLWNSTYSQIFQAIAPLSTFVRRSEGDHICVAEIYHNYLWLTEELTQLAANGNTVAGLMAQFVTNRLCETADGTLAELAYVFTPIGFHWFRTRKSKINLDSKESDADAERVFNEQEKMTKKLQDLGVYLMKEAKGLRICFEDYLSGDGPDSEAILTEWWKRNAHTSFPNPNISWMSPAETINRKLFSSLAVILLELPGTEAVCERLVSRFEALFPKSRCLSGDDLIKAQMRIKMFHAWDGIFKDSRPRKSKPTANSAGRNIWKRC
jgi:hypothetical protein